MPYHSAPVKSADLLAAIRPAPHLVAEFRKERGLARRHTGDDYMLGRTKMLWCATCATHLASDGFSAQQRRNVSVLETQLSDAQFKGRVPRAETIDNWIDGSVSLFIREKKHLDDADTGDGCCHGREQAAP